MQGRVGYEQIYKRLEKCVCVPVEGGPADLAGNGLRDSQTAVHILVAS